jgi:hypothetical protein
MSMARRLELQLCLIMRQRLLCRRERKRRRVSLQLRLGRKHLRLRCARGEYALVRAQKRAQSRRRRIQRHLAGLPLPPGKVINLVSLSSHDFFLSDTRTLRTVIEGFFAAISLTTSFICLHGSAHGAQKLSKVMRLRSASMTEVNCSGEVISIGALDCDVILYHFSRFLCLVRAGPS